jgi:hypothetical protein
MKYEWDEHTVQYARELREKLIFKCVKCDYATKRVRNLKRHPETRHRADSKEKTARPGEINNKRKDPGDHHKFNGLGSPSRNPAAAEEKKKKVDNFPVFEPPRKVSRTTQGDAPGSSKTQSKSPAVDCGKLTSADKKAKKTVSTSTQTLQSGSQAMSTEVQRDQVNVRMGFKRLQ